MSITTLQPDTPFGVAARVTIEKHFDQMMKNLPGTRDGSDIEALHDMRVASRRLRAALRVFRSCFPKQAYALVFEQVRDVTLALGTVRDQDVFIDFLTNYASTNDGIEWLIEREQADREKSRLELFEALGDSKQIDLARRLIDLLSHISMTEETSENGDDCRFAAQAAPLVAPRLAELLELSASISDPSKVTELHQMRIAAKRLRYTLETFTACFGQPLLDKINDTKLLQEQLGTIHDDDVWMDKLHLYQNEPGLPPDQVEALGLLIEERHNHRDETYRETLAHWQELIKAHFAGNIVKLVSDVPNAVEPDLTSDVQLPTSNIEQKQEVPLHQEVVTMSEEIEKQAETEEQPAPKPIRKRRTATAKAVEEIAIEPEASPAEEAVSAAPLVHSVISDLKQLVVTTTSRFSEASFLTPKLEKQLGKLDDMLGELPKTLSELKFKKAAKAEKQLAQLREFMTSYPREGANISEKHAEKLREEIGSSRRKLKEL